MFDRQKITVVSVTLALVMFAAGCGKKKPPPPPPPPPQPVTNTAPSRPPINTSPAPVVASFSAEPTSIERGQSSTLRWEVSGDITGVAIDQTIGPVQNTGSRRVFPSNSTTYTLTATGPGGSTTSSTIVVVTSPTAPPPPIDSGAGGRTVTEFLESQVHDIYFDYDKSDISGDGRNTLTQDAAALKNMFTRFPNASIIVEGHCDERGSAEYNLGLGDRRSSSVMEFLVQLGVPADHLKPISYGKERPQCSESGESCFQKNRRVHFSPGQ